MTVLIAEDEPVSRRLLERAVRKFGHDIVLASDGATAWEQFNSGDFGFVITDWVMPGIDGLELCQRIRMSPRQNYVYVIMLTSCDGPQDLLTGMNAGADDFLIKPFDVSELHVRMRAAERILKLQQELCEKNQELATINTRLRRLSRVDALTQLGNRLAFEEQISEFHQLALRYGRRYGVVMCDVDQFKSFNDTQGHLAGDEALRRTAGAIRNCLRASDRAFRYGGEEIVVLLPEQSPQESLYTAERLRATVEGLDLRRITPGTYRCITVSCGVSGFPIDGQTPREWEQVIEWADQALYRAKSLGRNRVEMAKICQEAPVA